eukprot:TRINITY_DN1241_c0_g1_i1.p2 TRINITY_DN1241_c0_g1~~TRINITY_DN1241_c0_g1_i1.p2  ORF type:complete len:136 (-),score=35.28 TRINITY_DN1241_c0_g1_i1:175-582(-)
MRRRDVCSFMLMALVLSVSMARPFSSDEQNALKKAADELSRVGDVPEDLVLKREIHGMHVKFEQNAPAERKERKKHAKAGDDDDDDIAETPKSQGLSAEEEKEALNDIVIKRVSGFGHRERRNGNLGHLVHIMTT